MGHHSNIIALLGHPSKNFKKRAEKKQHICFIYTYF